MTKPEWFKGEQGEIADRPQHHPQTPQADGGTPAAAGGSAPEQDVPPSDGGAAAPGGSTSPAASEAHAPPSTPEQVIAQADLEWRLAEAFHDRRCAYGTACYDRAAHIIWPHGDDARALAPFVAQLLAEQSDAAAPLALHRERLIAAIDEAIAGYAYDTANPVAAVIADAVLATAVDASNQQHVYLSTACLHGIHAHCQCDTSIHGTPKEPGKCKWCDARCRCSCHPWTTDGSAS